ncbi:flagellar basal body rod protein FlgB [Kistimonas scapharcae]|uniref:Flagellar basal body rod protein FlgB n=1 Tax=Kistimonas scapharcae TaxID=1036133 RepID=A0ABP8V2N3_9GAMM
MGISFEKGLGIHPSALQFRAQRSTVLASNLANVDTPGFKARDVVFAFDHTLENAVALSSPDTRHMGLSSQSAEGRMMYRIPYQQTTDDNTVELGIEQAAFARNTLDFQTSFTFLNMKFKGLDRAINGR